MVDSHYVCYILNDDHDEPCRSEVVMNERRVVDRTEPIRTEEKKKETTTKIYIYITIVLIEIRAYAVYTLIISIRRLLFSFGHGKAYLLLDDGKKLKRTIRTHRHTCV